MQRAGACRAPSYHIVDRRNFRKMLVLRKNSGRLFTASYAHLHLGDSDEENLQLDFARYRIFIKGRNLSPIHWAVSDHRLAYLCESNHVDGVSADETVVSEIKFILTNADARK